MQRPLPEILYHGTSFDFDEFNSSHLGFAYGTAPINMAGFNFSNSFNVAKTFGTRIIAAQLKIERPYVIDAKGLSYSEFKHHINETLAKINRSQFDGVIIRNYADAGILSGEYLQSDHFIVFDPSQITIIHPNLKWAPSIENIMEKCPTDTDLNICIGNFKWEIGQATLQRGDTNIPDSLGDQLFRMSLKLSWHSGHPDTDPITQEMLNHAVFLLTKHENERYQASLLSAVKPKPKF